MAFTAEQNAALEAQGRVIVSASAGSGKTTVMIEKIIRLIRDGTDVGEILAVTFTKKAASQMKEKLSKALIENINAADITPDKRARLKKQLAGVASADISTIHSFCAKLIRSHFYAAGVDSAFRVIGGDDAEGVALKNEALDELLEEGYETGEEDFAHLLSAYWRKKSDDALRGIFLSVYEKLRIRADYKEYLARSAAYDEQTFAEICRDLHKLFIEKCDYYSDLVQDEKNYFEIVGANSQIALAGELCAWLETLRNTRDYFDIPRVEKPKFTPNRGSKKDDDLKKEHVSRLSFLKNRVVKAYEEETAKLLSRDEELNKFLRSGRTAAALAKYLAIFDEKYEKQKRERGVLDYNDLEHIALALLSDEEIAKETREKYRYVFVDEYQDVNPVQEAIISKIGGDNLFLVGDVKQSIYGFRGSKPKFFVEKQEAFAAGEGRNLAMTRNFRSSDKVLEAVNSQFSLVMTPHVSDVDYARDSVMERGGRYALNSGKVQIHFLGKEEKSLEKERGVYSVRENADRRGSEINLAAKTIMQIIQDERASKWFDPDKGEFRQTRYSDIAILSRKKQGQIARTVAALSDAGLPVTAAAAVNVCDYAEVKTLVDVLSLIDNAKQDVPLCSALSSAMGKLTADELAQIRLSYREEKFFRNACARYAQEKEDALSEKLRAFYAYYEKVRNLSRVLTAGEILTLILAETRMEADFLSQENGASRLRRIRRFIEETNAPEPLSVHDFLARLRDLDYKIEYSENGGEDSVKVLTMHSSKGLEYPVVILDDLSAPFHGVDRDEVLAEEKYGLAPRAFDEEKMLKAPTLLRRLFEVKEASNSVTDGLNLYYVALTRAKYSLHMIFKEREAMSDVKYAKSYADMTDFTVWERYVVEDNVPMLEKQERTALVFRPDETLVRRIMDAFSRKYPYAGYENLLVKSSASKLLSLREGEDFAWNQTVGFGKIVEGDVMEDASETDLENRNELGTAYHAFLEYFDFSLLYDERGNAVSGEVLQEIVASAFTEFFNRNEAQAALLKIEKLTAILSNPVFYTLRDMRLYKERDFLARLSARRTYALAGVELPVLEETDRDGVIYQGAIDLLAIGEEIRIIDYKYSSKDRSYLKTRYTPQLLLYRMAVAKILGVDEAKIRCTIVNIDRGFEVEIE